MNFVLLDVAIGLVTVYVLVALLCSGIQELIAAWLGLRGRTLWEGVQSILIANETPAKPDKEQEAADKYATEKLGAEIASEMLKHPLIVGQVADKFGLLDLFRWIRGTRIPTADVSTKSPSYLDSKTFANVFSDVVNKKFGNGSHGFSEFLRAVVLMSDGPLKDVLQGIVAPARGDAELARQSIEQWFDAAMERVTGWYKRRTQALLFLIGLATAVILNIDSLQITRELWNAPALRSAMVEQAQRIVKENPDYATAKGKALTEMAKKDIDALPSSLPMGWPAAWWSNNNGEAVPNLSDHWSDVLFMIFGWLMTASAAAVGAPFWFDLLSKLVPLRSSGPKPASASETASQNKRVDSQGGTAPQPSLPAARPTGIVKTEPFRSALNEYEGRILDEDAILGIKKRLGVSGDALANPVFDQATRNAIRVAQARLELPPSGELSEMLVQRLSE